MRRANGHLAWWVMLSGILFLGTSPLPHPIHLSVTDMQYQAARQVFQVSVKLFTDDLAAAIPPPPTEGATTAVRDTLLRHYMRQHLHISVDGQEIPLSWLGHTGKADNITWCYFELAATTPPAIVSVSNTLLLAAFPDQRNIVYVQAGDRRRSLLLQKGKTSGEVSF